MQVELVTPVPQIPVEKLKLVRRLRRLMRGDPVSVALRIVRGGEPLPPLELNPDDVATIVADVMADLVLLGKNLDVVLWNPSSEFDVLLVEFIVRLEELLRRLKRRLLETLAVKYEIAKARVWDFITTGLAILRLAPHVEGESPREDLVRLLE